MSNIEEALWNYIDGNCSTEEQKNISILIEQNEQYRLKYQELLNLNLEFAAMELDEPPMAFTYNVIETIRAGHAQKPLKAAINKRIILGIALFFVLTIMALLVYTLSNISLSAGIGAVHVPSNYKMPDISNFITKPVIEGFLFFDLVLALFLFDAYIRRKRYSGQV